MLPYLNHMPRLFSRFGFAIALLSGMAAFAQPGKDNIGTEVINVVRPYTPSVSDAFKIKETPNFDIENLEKITPQQYQMQLFPVASTFKPEKGRAAAAEKDPEAKRFDHFARLAVGNFARIQADVFLSKALNNNELFDVSFRHRSVNSTLSDALLPATFMQNALKAAYRVNNTSFSYEVSGGLQHTLLHWYGVRPDYWDAATLDALQTKQTFTQFEVGGNLQFREKVLREAAVQYTYLADAFNSNEHHLIVNPKWAMDFNEHHIEANTTFDYLKGHFDQQFNVTDENNYGFMKVAFSPTYRYSHQDLDLKAGVSLQYLGAQHGESKLYFYPIAEGTYRLISNVLHVYGGIEGGLIQNSYSQFVQQNYMVSPTLLIAPTDQKAALHIGLKGKWAKNISYHAKASYSTENNKALLVSNGVANALQTDKGYLYGNTFGVVYDRVNTFGLLGELRSEWSNKYQIFVQGNLQSYQTLVESQPWNLPTFTMQSGFDYAITDKWKLKSELYVVWPRYDRWVSPLAAQPIFEEVRLPAYADLNAQVTYAYNTRWTFYAQGNNLFNQKANRWLNYPVMGIQVLAGAQYRFDF